ncbi:MAG: HD domain-containing protein [Spirochaetales bacterium]|nr:HD domain-containing protein [Spirochaetales bacterium]
MSIILEVEEKKTKQPYNSRIIESYINFITVHYPDLDIYEMLKKSKMTAYEVEDHGHWFTQEQVDLFHEQLIEKTHDPLISRKAGRFMAKAKASGEIRYFFLGIIGLLSAYKMVGKAAKNMTKSTTFDVKSLSENSVEILVKQNTGYSEKEYQCQNRMGMFEAIAEALKAGEIVVDQPECIFKGDDCCRYVITWGKSSTKIIRKAGKILIPVFLLPSIVSVLHFRFAPSVTVGAMASLILVLFFTVYVLNKEKKELQSALETSNRSPEKWIEQIDINYNNNLLSFEIGQVISMHTNIDDVLSSVVQISERRLDYDRGAIFLADDKRKALTYRAGFGYIDEYLKLLKEVNFNLDHSNSRGIFIKSFNEQKPFLINNIEKVEKDLTPRSLKFSKSIGSHSFICCPITYEGESLGIIVADNVNSRRNLTQSDLSLFMGIASSIGNSLKTAELFESKEKQFKSTFEVLASSIDARDNLTAGHSENVAKYSMDICQAMGLDAEYSEVVRLAALFHDYGKIGIPDSILKKEGPLTEAEYTEIKSHAKKTRELLEKISFEGSHQKIPEIAGAHHERMDGKGYPDGLKGMDIPLGARIIAVADYFEALTAERHYRSPMTMYAAVTQLLIASGDHLDDEIVSIFISTLEIEHNLNLGTSPLAV